MVTVGGFFGDRVVGCVEVEVWLWVCCSGVVWLAGRAWSAGLGS